MFKVSVPYFFRHFPEHHEGHLSLLRSSIVNNRTQSVVSDDLGMWEYANYANPKHELKVKDKADLLEAFIGALYIDKDLEYCQKFAEVCFFPRLNTFIVNQEWNDPKSKLQQCCLTLRTMNGKEPDIPVYKVGLPRLSLNQNQNCSPLRSPTPKVQPTPESTEWWFTFEMKGWPRPKATAFKKLR